MSDQKFIKEILDELYPSVPIPLNHSDPFTLLVAVLLSAQCTDERVNLVTPALFKIGPTPEEIVKKVFLRNTTLHQNLWFSKYESKKRKN